MAVSLTAALSHRSAALHHGLEVGTAPTLPEVVVRSNRRLDPGQQARAAVRWRPVEPAELRAGTTGLIRTVVDCARDLSFPEALAVADQGRRLVIEVESFTHHAHRRGFRKDLQRYTDLVVHGWTVLRFSWADVMLRPERVLWALRSWREARDEGRPVGHPPRAGHTGVQIGA